MLQAQAWRGPTDDELVDVADVFKKTGILTVKDRVTGAMFKDAQKRAQHQTAPDYGKPFQRGGAYDPRRATEGGSGAISANEDEFRVRSVWLEFVGSKRYPKGLAVGGSEVWVRDVPLALGGGALSCVHWRPDISTGEMERLRHWVDDKTWVTNEMIAANDVENIRRREQRLVSQEDPVGVLTKALQAALSNTQLDKMNAALAAQGLAFNPSTGKIEPVAAVAAK